MPVKRTGRAVAHDENADPAVVERRRKQRELKQRSRARKRVRLCLSQFAHHSSPLGFLCVNSPFLFVCLKSDVEWMQEQVRLLEATYNQLYAAKVVSAQTPSLHVANTHISATTANANGYRPPSSVSSALSIVLHEKYVHSKREVESLRQQIAAMRLKLEEYERFISNVDGYFIRLEKPRIVPLLPQKPTTPRSRSSQVERGAAPTILSETEAQRIVAGCYRDIFHRKWSGTCMSTGAHIMGWRDKRYVDGATLHFSLTKHFEFATVEQFMLNTWAIVTSEKMEHVRAVQKTTLGIKVLQVINDDTMVMQRRVFHAHLSTVACINMLAFRARTPKGYIVGYKSVKLPEYENHDVFVYDDDQRKMIGDHAAELKHVWVDTFQYWVFEEDDVSFSEEAITHFIESVSTADDVSSSLERMLTQSPAPGLKVIMGGTTSNRDVDYISYFLVEVVSCIIRWENSVAASRLTFLDLPTDGE